VPTYQYACTECGEQIEKVQKFSDTPLSVCPVCGGRLRKVFSPVGIVFKGSGFYRNDSRSGAITAEKSKDNQPNGSGSQSTAADSGTGTSASGADSKDGKAGDRKDGDRKDGDRKDGDRKDGKKSAEPASSGSSSSSSSSSSAEKVA
jgi:putative FmdB family regulatory protein